MTASSYAAGTCVVAFAPLFPAATTIVTPASRARHIALCKASLFELPQLLSEAPPPPRLMLATVIGPPFAGALLVTKSSPQMTDDHVPEPELLRTRTAHSLASGATPTTPRELSAAAIVPATCVPCPLSSSHFVGSTAAPLATKFCPPRILACKYGWSLSTPVSTTHTVTPFPVFTTRSASILSTPQGKVCTGCEGAGLPFPCTCTSTSYSTLIIFLFFNKPLSDVSRTSIAKTLSKKEYSCSTLPFAFRTALVSGAPLNCKKTRTVSG